VSAEIRSGQTTRLFRKEIDSLNPQEIKIACLDYSPEATITPDFWYLQSQRVIPKPWAILETYRPDDAGARPE
jgi:hypoxanthine phosphoribosyltransferase